MVAARTAFRALVELTTFDSRGIVSASTRQLFPRQRDIAIVSVRRERQEARERYDRFNAAEKPLSAEILHPGEAFFCFTGAQ